MQAARAGGAVPGDTPTRDRIESVAARLFHQQGYQATTMRELAAGVGIKAGSLYNHFSSKQELFFRICYDTMCDMEAAVMAEMSGVEGPEARLRAFVRAHTRYCIVERYRARVADDLRNLEPGNLEQVLEMRDRYELVLREVLTALRAAHHGAVPDVPVTANAIATMASQVSWWYRDDGRMSADDIAETYADLALGAALSRRRPPAGIPRERRRRRT